MIHANGADGKDKKPLGNFIVRSPRLNGVITVVVPPAAYKSRAGFH
jgi:hypothetical protein